MVDVAKQLPVHGRHSAGCAKYIGRVGALAIALGIGAAVATSPGMAWATPEDHSSTTTAGEADATDTTTDTSADSSPSSPPSSTASDSTPATGAQTTPSTGTTTAQSSAETTVTTTTGPEVTIRSSGGANTSTHDGLTGSTDSNDTTETASAPPPEVSESAPSVPQPDPPPSESSAVVPNSDVQQVGTPSRRTSVTPQRLTRKSLARTTPATESVPAQAVESEARFSAAATDPSEDVAPTTALGAARPPTPSSSVADVVASVLAIPRTLMAAVFAPLVAPGPAGPADPPLLWAVLGWVRRQFTEDAVNSTSVPKPLQTAEIEPSQTDEIEPSQTAEIEPLAAAQAEAVDAFAAADAAAVQALLPADFERTVVVAGLNGPVAFRFLPNGEILIAEKDGAIKVFDVDHLHTAITLPVSSDAERGIGGIEVDPHFGETVAGTGYVYVSYTTAANRDRLSRFTMTGETIDPGSERVLMEGDQAAGDLHHAGDIHFGPDDKLYWSKGDNTIATNSQDLSNMYGKILRLNPEDGSAPADNPFVGDPGVLPQIYAYGFRNPFRFAFAPGGQLLVADVGAAAWEELNLVTAGANYGWPLAEGNCTAACAFVNPIYTYPHTPVGSGASIQSVLVYDGATFGESYQNKVFIADGTQQFIKVLTFDSEFTSLISESTFDTLVGNTVQLTQGPDDNIYQLAIDQGALIRIAPSGGNRAPTAVITATPTYGYGPLNVGFSAANSSDPEGGNLTYAWNFGDPSTTSDVSTNQNATWRYTTNGRYVATLTVSDGAKVGQTTQTIVVGSTPPVAQIQQVTTPRGDLTYYAGDTISFSALTGAGVDAEDGALPSSAYHWTVDFHHNTHLHPFRDDIVGPTGSITIPRTPDQLDNTWYRINLTVTDSSGLSSTQSIDVLPRTVALTFNATNTDGTPNPNATFTVDGIPITGTYTENAVVGVQRVLSAPSTQFANGAQLTFAGWSDGGAQTHTITTPATAATYSVKYAVPPVVVSSSAPTGVSPMGVVVSGTKTYVANQGSNTVSVIDRANPTAAPVTINVVASPIAIALAADGTRAYVAGNDAVSVINTATNQVVTSVSLNGGGQAYGIAVAPSGNRVYVTTIGTGRVSVINVNTTANTYALGATVAVDANPVGIALSADGTRAYVANWGSGTVTVLNTSTATPTLVSRVAVGTGAAYVAVSPDGSRAYVSSYDSGKVTVLNTTAATPTVATTITVGAQPFGLALESRWRHAVCGQRQ